MAWLAEKGERARSRPARSSTSRPAGRALLRDRERPWVDFIDHKPGMEIWIAEADAGTFIGDIATFTGEPPWRSASRPRRPTPSPSTARGCARCWRPSRRWASWCSAPSSPAVAWHEGAGHGVLRLIAERGSRRAFEVRDLPERNLVPLQFHDVDLDPYADKILDWLDIARDETPVLVRYDRVLRNPPPPSSPASSACGRRWTAALRPGRARRRPGRARRGRVGGIGGAVDVRGRGLGAGRPGVTSSRIENYLGFPQRDLGSRADPRRHPSGPPLRRGPVELLPGRRADRRPRRAGSATSTTASMSSAGPW